MHPEKRTLGRFANGVCDARSNDQNTALDFPSDQLSSYMTISSQRTFTSLGSMYCLGFSRSIISSSDENKLSSSSSIEAARMEFSSSER
mmetsp:Transcript_638/g.1196  ORF Transcript_638/g.1196 Transcript_638/m.1196 type:complete len:89 (-) Transcript_638:626-892(-)